MILRRVNRNYKTSYAIHQRFQHVSDSVSRDICEDIKALVHILANTWVRVGKLCAKVFDGCCDNCRVISCVAYLAELDQSISCLLYSHNRNLRGVEYTSQTLVREGLYRWREIS